MGILCNHGVQLNVITFILLYMESKVILEKLGPDEILVLSVEGRLLTYAVNQKGNLVIERSIIPVSQVNLMCERYDDLNLFDYNIVDMGGMYVATDVISKALHARKQAREHRKK